MNQAEQPKSYQYDAFISYNRKDKAFAVKLEQALENYKPPKDLDVPQRPFNIFRDEGDMVGNEYYSSIDRLLQDSARLIVICSPNSRRSDFVNDEIRRFAKANSPENIIPVLIAGVPDNEAKAEQEAEKAFPAALFGAMAMPLAKDYRGFETGKDKIDKSPFENSWYGLLADLYNKSRREIEERDKKKQQRQRRIRNGIVAGVMVLPLMRKHMGKGDEGVSIPGLLSLEGVTPERAAAFFSEESLRFNRSKNVLQVFVKSRNFQ